MKELYLAIELENYEKIFTSISQGSDRKKKAFSLLDLCIKIQ